MVSFERDQRNSSVVLVVDTSTGMGSNVEQTRLALRNFAISAGPLDETALLTFPGHPQLVSDFTCDFAALTSDLVSERAAGDTALNDALWQALQVVRGGHNPPKTLIVLRCQLHEKRHAPEPVPPGAASRETPPAQLSPGTQIFPVGRHVAAALDHLADELILGELNRDSIQRRPALASTAVRPFRYCAGIGSPLQASITGLHGAQPARCVKVPRP